MKLNAAEGKAILDSNETHGCLTFTLRGVPADSGKVQDLDWVAFQLYQSSGSWVSAVITVQISYDGANFVAYPDGAVTYSAAGAQPLLVTTGAAAVRLKVTTANGAAGVLYVAASGGAEK